MNRSGVLLPKDTLKGYSFNQQITSYMPTECPMYTRLPTAHMLSVTHSGRNTAVPISGKPGELLAVLRKARWPALLFASCGQAVRIPKAILPSLLDSFQVTVPLVPPLSDGSSYRDPREAGLLQASGPTWARVRWLSVGLPIQTTGSESGPGPSLRSNVRCCFVPKGPRVKACDQWGQSEWSIFSGRKLAETFRKGQLQIWLRYSCSWAPCIFSRMTGVVPFQIHHFENQLLSSGLFPGQVSAFTSPAGSDSRQRKNRGQVWRWWLCSIIWAPFLHLCSSQHRSQGPGPARAHSMHCRMRQSSVLSFANAPACSFGDWKSLEQGKLRRIGNHSAYQSI